MTKGLTDTPTDTSYICLFFFDLRRAFIGVSYLGMALVYTTYRPGPESRIGIQYCIERINLYKSRRTQKMS